VINFIIFIQRLSNAQRNERVANSLIKR